MKVLLAALLVASACASHADESAGVRVFESAQWVQHWFAGLPGEEVAWAPVRLPHNWYRNPPAIGNHGWYRIRFDVDYPTYRGQSLYFPKLVTQDLTVYVNGQAIWSLKEAYAPGVALTAVRIPIPAATLRRGENVILLQVAAYPQWFHGISRIYLGDTTALTQRAAARSMLQGEMIYVVAAAFGAIGLLSLLLWHRAGRDPVLFWYGISGVTLLVSTAVWYVSMWRPEFTGWRSGLIFMRFHGYLAPAFILHLRLAGRRQFWLEGGLWLMLALACFSVAQHDRWAPAGWVAWGMAFSLLPALLTIPLLASPRLRARPAVILLIVADVAAALLPLHDWATRFGLLDFDLPYLIYFAPPFVMLAAAVPILERMLAGWRATEENRLELERRVTAKALEIEASHRQLREAQREQEIAEERRRIMADMHDGLGARLVSLLSIAQSGKARHGEMREGLAAALDELRLTVDSVQPVEGDVGVVLGNVRHRMRSVFERAGVRLLWNVSALPRIESLTPERILAIQRIFLEVFSNALKHARARTVAVSAVRLPDAVQIVIADDGQGFEEGAVRSGNGLANLKRRAAQAGGTIALESGPGSGTRVTLTLPLADERTPGLPGTGQKDPTYPVQGITPAPESA